MSKRKHQYNNQFYGQGEAWQGQQAGRQGPWTQSGRGQMNRGAARAGSIVTIDLAQGIVSIPAGFTPAYTGGGGGGGNYQQPLQQQGRSQKNRAGTANPQAALSTLIQGNQRLANFLQSHSQQLQQATRTLQTQMSGQFPTGGRSSKARGRQKQPAY